METKQGQEQRNILARVSGEMGRDGTARTRFGSGIHCTDGLIVGGWDGTHGERDG